MQYPGIDIAWNKPRKIGFAVSPRDASKILGHKKQTTNHLTVIFHPYAGTPLLRLNFGMLDNIAESRQISRQLVQEFTHRTLFTVSLFQKCDLASDMHRVLYC